MGADENPLGFLRRWYLEQCDGEWEHEFGIRPATLDNPGLLAAVPRLPS